ITFWIKAKFIEEFYIVATTRNQLIDKIPTYAEYIIPQLRGRYINKYISYSSCFLYEGTWISKKTNEKVFFRNN
ncbi:hypothetical protein, partial [Methanococcus maripaludis]|uniref:hypothetical protein n=1 Tax=Methanococcus maripaludis TaxID=39152 RepID=UPI0033657445